MLGYLAGPRAGAVAYNAGHSHLLPASLAALALGNQTLLLGAVIWIAHIGFDRFAGYGLKYGGNRLRHAPRSRGSQREAGCRRRVLTWLSRSVAASTRAAARRTHDSLAFQQP